MELIDENGQPKFGTCFRCGSPISIPGIHIYTCSKCGWVETPEYQQYLFKCQKEDEINKRNRNCSTRKKKIVEGMSTTSDKDSEPSLLFEVVD
ncbi:MAG: hypothetical protein U7127_05300 [Phormidium sp.]